MEETLVAWSVQDAEDDLGLVVFAQNEESAKLMASGELNSEIYYLECRRESKYDCYASTGVVPSMVLIANGWWFECAECGYRINNDEDGDKPLSDVIDTCGNAVYCNQQCKTAREKYDAKQRDKS